MAKSKFTVVLVHGHGRERQQLKSLIVEAGYSCIVLKDDVRKKGWLFDVWRDTIWDQAHAVVVLMTRDDKVGARFRARQNVVFELGYCFGAFDSLDPRATYDALDAVIVVAERNVELFADIEGLMRVEFVGGALSDRKGEILAKLKRAYKKAKRFYDL